MATRTSQALPRDLRFEPTPKRVRAQAAGATVADSLAALLVWEPSRAVPVEERDVAWTYEAPFPDAPEIAGLVLTSDV